MDKKQKKLFNQLVEEEANKHENAKLYKKVLTDFFDESSGHADDIEYAEQVLNSGTQKKA